MTATVVDLAPATFEAFWQECPRTVGKILAYALWQAITGDGLDTRNLNRDSGEYLDVSIKATPQELVDGMKLYRKRGWVTEEPEARYIRPPSTWLTRAAGPGAGRLLRRTPRGDGSARLRRSAHMAAQGTTPPGAPSPRAQGRVRASLTP